MHGAGSQRSDPKTGEASRFPYGRGPQGDVIRIENGVRCVRGGNVVELKTGPKVEARKLQPMRPHQGPPTEGGRAAGDHPDR